MKPTINNIEKAVSEKLRLLSREKQEEVLDFVQFLLYKSQPTKQFSISSKSSTSPTETLSSRVLKLLQRKPLSVSSESSTSSTETPPLKRSLLDGEDYLIDPAITRSHDAFLKGYAPEDEGLYDDY